MSKALTHRQQKKIKVTLKNLGLNMSDITERSKSDRIEHGVMAAIIIIGIPLVNYISPFLVGTWFSNNISPNLGPVDWAVMILLGGWHLWKAIKK